MKSIGIKLWAGMMALVIIVLLLLWLFQIVFLEKFYTSIRVMNVRNEAVSIARLLEGENKAEFETRAEAFAFNNNLSIEVLSPDGNTLFTTGSTGYGGQMPMMRNRERGEAFKEVLTGKEIKITLTHPRFGNRFMLIGLPVKEAGEVAGVLLVNMPLASIEETTSILKKQLIFITLILLIAAIIISYIISKSFIKPILEIKRVSESMSKGDFSDRIQSNSKDEIGELAETINHMGQELSKIEQLRKDLVANVSHELRTPLSLIRGYAETIRDVSGNIPEKREKQLEIIIEESERLSKIVDDILNLSQMQSGYLDLRLQQFVINRTAEEVVKRFDILSEKTGIKIMVEPSKDVMVTADESKLEQVLYNLINNAFNHTFESGIIRVRVIDWQDNVKVEVSDTGTGISDEDIGHVWDRYYKADKTSVRKMVGTGLGLAIVKGILEAHKASYGVESKKGEGTTFWFSLKK